MLLLLLKLKIENCEMLHKRKIFEINKLKKNAFNEDTEISIKKHIIRIVNN